MRLQRLFQPFQINQMTVKNRLAMTAMHLLYTEDGSVNQRTKDFYLARAKGGVGMIIAGGTAADPYIGYSHMLRMDDDRFIPGWRELADAVHAYDCKALWRKSGDSAPSQTWKPSNGRTTSSPPAATAGRNL